MNGYGVKRMLGFLCFFAVFFTNFCFSQEQSQPSQEIVVPMIVSADNPVTIRGFVTVDGREAMEDAKVLISGNPAIVTDTQGQYSGSAYSSSFNVSVYSANGEFIGEKQVIVEKGQKDINLDFQFDYARIFGEITENGVSLAGAKIFIGKNGIINTDQSGSYESKVQAGEERVFAITSAGEFIGEEFLILSKGEEKRVSFDFKPAFIEVTVTDAGKPVSGAKVFIGRNSPAITDKSGRCVQKVFPGNVSIYVRDSNGRVFGERSVTAILGQTVTVDIGK